MKICFIVTNFNNSEFTFLLCDSVKNLNGLLIDLIVVDNSSNSNEIEELREIESKYDFCRVIYNKDNVGYFEGLNCGIRSIDPLTYEYIVIGNNDLQFDNSFVNQIKSLPKSIASKYPIIAPDIVTLDNVHQNPHVIHKISQFREFMYDAYYSNYIVSRVIWRLARLFSFISSRTDDQQYLNGREIYQGYGACYILTPKFFENFSCLWAPTFLMGEEFFLWKQLNDKGLKLWYEPSVQVRHYDHASVSKLPSRKMWEISKESHKVYRKYLRNANR